MDLLDKACSSAYPEWKNQAVWECCVRWKVGIRHSIEVPLFWGRIMALWATTSSMNIHEPTNHGFTQSDQGIRWLLVGWKQPMHEPMTQIGIFGWVWIS